MKREACGFSSSRGLCNYCGMLRVLRLVSILFFCLFALCKGVSDFSVAVAAETASITVTSPNGGEEWDEETLHVITWESTGITGFCKIETSNDGGRTWAWLTSGASGGSHNWTLPDVASDQTSCRIRIMSRSQPDVSDTSDGNYTIVDTDRTGPSQEEGPSAQESHSAPVPAQCLYPQGDGNGEPAELQPTLRWSSTASADNPLHYEVYLSMVPEQAFQRDAAALIEEGQAVGPESSTSLGYYLNPEGTYYWVVVLSDGTAVSVSPTWTFTVQKAPSTLDPSAASFEELFYAHLLYKMLSTSPPQHKPLSDYLEFAQTELALGSVRTTVLSLSLGALGAVTGVSTYPLSVATAILGWVNTGLGDAARHQQRAIDRHEVPDSSGYICRPKAAAVDDEIVSLMLAGLDKLAKCPGNPMVGSAFAAARFGVPIAVDVARAYWEGAMDMLSRQISPSPLPAWFGVLLRDPLNTYDTFRYLAGWLHCHVLDNEYEALRDASTEFIRQFDQLVQQLREYLGCL